MPQLPKKGEKYDDEWHFAAFHNNRIRGVGIDAIRLEAEIDPRNVSSAGRLERLGFVKEGLLRDRWIVNDEISDSGIYGLLRKEWQS